MAETEIKREATSKRIVGALSALYFRQDIDALTGQSVRKVLTATFGQEVELPESEERRLEANGALLPKGSKPEDALRDHEARSDAYRAQRGDQEALERHHQRLAAGRQGGGDVVNVDAGVEERSVADLAEWIRENKPNADDTVALAEGDQRKAAKVLEAERMATDSNPRATVEQRLSKIVEG